MHANELSFLAGNFYFDPNQANLETAISDVKRALALNPSHAASHAQLANLMENNIFMGGEKNKDGARIEACRLASRAVVLSRDDPQSIGIAVFPISQLCGKSARAVQLSERAINENPENGVAWAHYGFALAISSETQAALSALDKAEQRDPGGFFVRYLLDHIRALTHFHNGDWAKGVQLARKAVNVDPGLYYLQIFLANGLGLMGDEDGAREQWQLIKARFPGLTVERCFWFFKNHKSEEKAQRWVEGLRRAQVES